MELCRAVELGQAPAHVRRAARDRADDEGLHQLPDGYWLFCGPLERTAGHRYRLVSADVLGPNDEEAPADARVKALVQHERPAPGTPTAQVLTRPFLLLSAPPGLVLEVVLLEPDGRERSYRAV